MSHPNCVNCPVGGTFVSPPGMCSKPASDGLPISCVGEWSEEKKAHVLHYVNISRAARRKFRCTTYIDLFSGPGMYRLRPSGAEVPSAALAAIQSAVSSGTAFSHVFLADAAPEFIDALSQRVVRLGVSATTRCGTAERTVLDVGQVVPHHALHFAFLDPYNLGNLPFSILRSLSEFPKIDMLVHVSRLDILRNLGNYEMREDETPLDGFAPGWRSVMDPSMSQAGRRAQVLGHWGTLVKSLGLEVGIQQPVMDLYWLAFAARNPKALEFWEKIRGAGQQRQLL